MIKNLAKQIPRQEHQSVLEDKAKRRRRSKASPTEGSDVESSWDQKADSPKEVQSPDLPAHDRVDKKIEQVKEAQQEKHKELRKVFEFNSDLTFNQNKIEFVLQIQKEAKHMKKVIENSAQHYQDMVEPQIQVTA